MDDLLWCANLPVEVARDLASAHAVLVKSGKEGIEAFCKAHRLHPKICASLLEEAVDGFEAAYARLRRTYNTTVIDEVDAPAARARAAEEGLSTLVRLLDNRLLTENDGLPVTIFLSGPKSLTEHFMGDKRFYVFGELHGYEGHCPDGPDTTSIEKYLSNLFVSTNAFLDFFLEDLADPPPPKDLSLSELYPREIALFPQLPFMHRLRMVLGDCIHANTRFDERCHLSRQHYSDIRMVGGTPHTFARYIKASTYAALREPQSTDRRRELARLYSVYLEAPDRREFIQQNYDANRILQKEIDKALPEMRERIREFVGTSVREVYDEVHEELDELMTAIFKEVLDRPFANVVFHQRPLMRVVHLMTMVFCTTVDGYTLARAFKRFDTSKDAIPGVGTWDQPEVPHNVVCYFGDRHARAIRRFLDQVGFERAPGAGIEFSPRCVELTKVKQPFFS